VKWTRPRALRPGDLVGVCAPSSVVDPEGLDRGVAALESFGLNVAIGDAVRTRWRFTAGTIEDRFRDLRGFWDDDAVAGIFCARGGGGGARVFGRLDAAAMAARPKVFVGYSDITFLHSLLNGHGLVTFHGPMVALHDFAEGCVDDASFRAAIFGEGAPYESAPGAMRMLRPGTAEGRLQGGCLSILASGAATPFALRPDPEGTVLFLEDIYEAPFRIDRALMQLRASGAFEGVRGFVFGEMQECNPPEGAGYTLDEVILDALSGLDVPVAIGLASGHTGNPNVTLPFGVRARLACAGDARLKVLEASVQ
jgi:muramoyltetrapeptide carboxypeptidase